MKLKLAAVLGLLAIACVTVSPAEACSRVLYHGPEDTVLTGRTMVRIRTENARLPEE